MTSEEAGRFFRYSLFDEVLREVGGNKIALAHNMNDQAETMIMHFLRGSGITGLGGIKPYRDGKFIRPLILCSRDEIESYCSENNLEPVIDSTNKEEIYLRNKIRLDLIPYIKNKFNPNIVETLSNSSEIFRDENEYLLIQAQESLSKITKNSEEYFIDKFNQLHICIKRRVIRSLIERVKGNLNGIESKHIEDCIDMIKKGYTGKHINLPDSIECSIQYDVFRIDKFNTIEEQICSQDYEYKLNIPGDTVIKEAKIVIHARILENNDLKITQNHFVKCFDYDKIKGALKIRNRRDGDYIYPSGMPGKKKLKDYFIDKKVPREKRNTSTLLVLGSEVLWIPGLRDTKNYKVDENTKNIIEITIERGA
jgi:tRNA(Ile)-lysidine synthase